MMAPATAVSGVTVEQYAGITAALAEDLPLDAVLAFEGLSPRTWKPVEVAWKLRLATEGVTAPLFQVFVERRAEAEDWLSRRIAPLEDDLGAWLSFLQAWSRHVAPFDMLVATGLRLSDVSRLQRRWARRFAEERALEARAAELVRKGPGPLPSITAGEIDHKPFRWSRVGARTKEPAGAPRTESPAPEVTPALLPVAAPELVVPSFMKVREPARPRCPLLRRSPPCRRRRLRLRRASPSAGQPMSTSRSSACRCPSPARPRKKWPCHARRRWTKPRRRRPPACQSRSRG
jgi:hypothetical protein